jgi:hypothetical protein
MKSKPPEITAAIRELIVNSYFSELAHRRINSLTEKERKKLARKGGKARAAALTKQERSRIAKLGGLAKAKKMEQIVKPKRGKSNEEAKRLYS